MKEDYGPYDSEFEAKWSTLSEARKNRTMIFVLIAGVMVIASVIYLYSQRQHDAFVDPKIKLQAP